MAAEDLDDLGCEYICLCSGGGVWRTGDQGLFCHAALGP